MKSFDNFFPGNQVKTRTRLKTRLKKQIIETKDKNKTKQEQEDKNKIDSTRRLKTNHHQDKGLKQQGQDKARTPKHDTPAKMR